MLPGCGAGLVGGALASNNDPPPPAEVQPPSLSLPAQDFPLVPVPAAIARTVVVANAQLLPTANLQVQLRAGGVSVEQGAPTIVSGPGSSTVVGFDLRTDPIRAALGADLDLAAVLAVLVDGSEIADPVPVTLLRQPRLRLLDGPTVFLSPIGGQTIRLAVRGMRSADQNGIQVAVTTADAVNTIATVTRLCQQPAFAEPVPGVDPPLLEGERLVTAEVPGNTFSGPATFSVDDPISGRSQAVGGAFYRPELSVMVPALGSARLGASVTLIGRALAPLIAGSTTGAIDFDRVAIDLRKGTRIGGVLDLDRETSTLDRLVFKMPPSPDGRPGDVTIVVKVAMPGATGEVLAEVQAQGLFVYANPEPVFGPRGTLFDVEPVALAPIALEGAPFEAQATDFGVLYTEGAGTTSVQLLASLENGLFTRFGNARRISAPQSLTELDPRDLTSADFDRDGVPDLFLVNGGSTTVATHDIVLGQAAPLPPLGNAVRFQTRQGMTRVRVGDFDGDGWGDLVLLPGPGADSNQPPVLLTSVVIAGQPSFGSHPLGVRQYRYDAIDVGDFDGDGNLDVAVAAGGTTLRLDIAYGRGDGTFDPVTVAMDLVVPIQGYVPDARSTAVGLHALGGSPTTMAIVLAGLPPTSGPVVPPAQNTPSMVMLLHPAVGPLGVEPRRYAQPLEGQLFRPGVPFRSSLAINLDGVGAGNDDLLVGATGGATTFSLGLLRYVESAGEFDPDAVTVFTELGAEVRGLYPGVAFPADPSRGQPEARAVFVWHEIDVDGRRERRLSTMLFFTDKGRGTLLSPDVGFDTGLQGVVGGRFSTVGIASNGATRDLALPANGKIRLGDNNGFGALAPGKEMDHLGLVPETVSVMAGPVGVADALVFVDDGERDGRLDGQLRIGMWRPEALGPISQVPTAISGDLRPLLPAHFVGAHVDASSKVTAADVDGDGHMDLVALIRFEGLRAEDDALLMVWRGSAGPPETPFPFVRPLATAILRVPGLATDFVLGDFAAEVDGAPVRLELAMAVPGGVGIDTDHVRFYRLVSDPVPGRDRWERSFDADDPTDRRAIIAGIAPTRLAAADFDGSGTVDLLIAAEGDAVRQDATLRLMLNDGRPAGRAGEVAVSAFIQSFGSPLVTLRGRQTELELGDINGDGSVDAMLAVEEVLADGRLSTSVQPFLNAGFGGFTAIAPLSPTRLGNRDTRLSIDLGDVNGDGLPDLSLGWHQPDGGGRNLRVLLGGSR
ncbi:MAG: FG-GAP-like repeat-containing protein [Planctomycetota bacterium]